eukprot:571706-Alexandrium_andersonii.AAC.1
MRTTELKLVATTASLFSKWAHQSATCCLVVLPDAEGACATTTASWRVAPEMVAMSNLGSTTIGCTS